MALGALVLVVEMLFFNTKLELCMNNVGTDRKENCFIHNCKNSSTYLLLLFSLVRFKILFVFFSFNSL